MIFITGPLYSGKRTFAQMLPGKALLPPTDRPQAPQTETDRKEKHMENFNDSKALAIEIAKILDKKKAHDVRVLKVESLTVLTDYFVIASGTSTTQVASLADEVEYELSQKGLEPYSTEGYDSKNWVLLDYSNVIVHVFVPNTRTYYDLEHLWADGEPIDISEYLTPDSTLE